MMTILVVVLQDDEYCLNAAVLQQMCQNATLIQIQMLVSLCRILSVGYCGYCCNGFKVSEVEKLLAQGVEPWDDDAGAVLLRL